MGSLVIGTKAVYAHPDVSAAMAMWSSRSSTRTQADFSALQSSGADSVHICPCALSAAELRVGTPFHTAVTNCRAATPFVTVENTEPVPSLPRKMCWSRQMSHPSARLGFFCCCWVFFFSFLKCTHSFSIVSRSPTNRFVCPRRLHVASLPSRPGTGRILQLELPLLWRAQLKGCALPSDLPCMCVVSWRSGFPGSPIHACPSSC